MGQHRLIALPLHPDDRARSLAELRDEVVDDGVAMVRVRRLARITRSDLSSPVVSSRIDAALAAAFSRAELTAMIDEQLRPVWAAPGGLVTGIHLHGDGTPEVPPGQDELWDTAWIYRDFREFSEILWGQDWDDISPAALAHGEHLYELWLDLFVAARDDIAAWLGEVGMSLDDLLAAIHDTFDLGGKALSELLDSFARWLFSQIGFSP